MIRLEAQSVPLGYLLEPLVVIDWRSAETGITALLEEHDFTKDGEQDPDFTKEFDFLEGKVPAGADGRGSLNFIRVIITAVMAYAVGGTSL